MIKKITTINFLLSTLVITSFSKQALPASKEITVAIDSLLNNSISQSKIPGAVLWIEKEGKSYHKSYGNKCITPAIKKMTNDTIFDAASLTKVMATAPSIMVLIDQGKISINDKVIKHLPQFEGTQKKRITIKQLLTHTSGLPPVLPRKPEWEGYDKAIDLCYSVNVIDNPGQKFRYSDVNFILLGEIVNRVSGLSLKKFSEKEIFYPLKMKDTCFLPNRKLIDRISPTTKEKGLLIHGVVHDPSARAMGGIAGHAGLFTTTNDLAKFCRMIVNDGKIGNVRILNKQSIELMTRNHTSITKHKVSRGLGWDIDSKYSGARGDIFPKMKSFGHTGWTGGSVWIHPNTKSFVILFSNRNHPIERRSIKSIQHELGNLSAKAFGLKSK
ncbi:beta-lactamase family protein [Verrucomicrobiales bacterium]|nr:beta-lactamase family protein [Verrucomicrobiales bacterium]